MKKVVALLALVLAAAALAACGDDSGTTTSTPTEGSGEAEAANGATAGAGSEGGGGESTVSLEADPDGQLAYTTDTASAQAGDVKIDFNNPEPVEHDVDVEDSNDEEIGGTDLISSDSTSVTLQDVKPGNYTFYCSVPGHREAGMEGTLTVE
ncbi:MAG: cupredoxin domain-containing protein [Solirubrobacterales bacterium]